MDNPSLPDPTILKLRSAWRAESEELIQVDEEIGADDHGYSYVYVFHRPADDTYWRTSGVCQGGGDYHQLRDEDDVDVTRVYPIETTITVFSSTPPKDNQNG